MNDYFNIILKNNKIILLQIENILLKYLNNRDFFNKPKDLEIYKEQFLKDIEENECLVVFSDSIFMNKNLISVSLKNKIILSNNVNSKDIDKVSYSFDYENKTLKCEAIVLIQKIGNDLLKTYITEECIYKDILIKNINFIFEDGKVIDEGELSIYFGYSEGISINMASLAYERCRELNKAGVYNALTDLNFFISVYQINKKHLYDFLFSGVPFAASFVDTLLLEYDISIEDKLKTINKFSFNINKVNFDLTISKRIS